MAHGNIGWVLGSCLVLTAFVGCGDGAPTPPPETAATGAAAPCEMIDMTPPDIARRLEGATLTQLGEATVRYEGGKRISSVRVLVQDGKSAQSRGGERDSSIYAPRIVCTSQCNGNTCSMSGCDANSWGCTSYYCSYGCTGTCTKTSTYDPD